jgi:uracil-DNA glycosylase
MTTEQLLNTIRSCSLCAPHLPLGPRPVFQFGAHAPILLVGQAPGRRVHETGLPFNDPSGDRLRQWLGVDRQQFYDPALFSIIPMGFCYPGTGKSGDLPPRPECAQQWRQPLLKALQRIELTVLLGQYAIRYHLGHGAKTLTQQVADWQSHWPHLLPMPHPSPRNNLWLKRNPWFEAEVLPQAKKRVASLLQRP